jgi:hypothetical protein
VSEPAPTGQSHYTPTTLEKTNMKTDDILRATNPNLLDPLDSSAFHPASDIAALRVPRDTIGEADEH